MYEDYDGDDAYGNGETDEGSDKGRNEGDWSNEEGYCEAGVYTRGKRDRDLVDLSGPGEFYEDTVDWPLSGQFHGDGDWAEEQAEKVVALPDEEKSWPDSFSKIRDLDMGDADLKRKFPLFPGKAAAREIMVTEGMYLPTLWLCHAWSMRFCSLISSPHSLSSTEQGESSYQWQAALERDILIYTNEKCVVILLVLTLPMGLESAPHATWVWHPQIPAQYTDVGVQGRCCIFLLGGSTR